MTSRSLMRRAAAVSAAVVAGATLVACSSGDDEGGGDVLHVTLVNHVWTDIVREAIPEFEEEHGVTVEVTQLGEDQMSDQYNVKLNSGATDIDVMMFRPLQEAKLFASNGYLSDLTEQVSGDAEWDWSDFQESPVAATTYDDAVIGVPIITEREVLYYRTDLLAAANLPVPTTLTELEDAARTIQEQNEGVAGFVARTNRSAAVTQFSSFLYSQGGDFVGDDGQATINTPEAKSAYDIYGRLIRDHGPENVSTDMSWAEAMAIFTQGQAAFYTEADSLYTNATDPENSQVSDTVGFAPFPAGDAGSRPYNIPSWALGINEFSENKDLAWDFIEWATSKARTLEIQQEGVPGARQSVWDDPAGIQTYPEDLAAAIAESIANGVDHDRPVVSSVPEAREIVGDPIVASITGGDVDAAADDANDRFATFLESEQ